MIKSIWDKYAEASILSILSCFTKGGLYLSSKIRKMFLAGADYF